MSGQLAIEQEKFRQKVAGAGFGSGRSGDRGLAGFEVNPEPFRGGPPPPLFSILPCHVNQRDAGTSGDEVCKDKLEHHNLSYRLPLAAQ